jgi:hypothetical protein
MQKQIRELIDKVADAHGLPSYVVEEIYLSQWRFVREVIRSGECKTVMLPKWGKYLVSSRKLEYIKKHKEANEGTSDALQGEE